MACIICAVWETECFYRRQASDRCTYNVFFFKTKWPPNAMGRIGECCLFRYGAASEVEGCTWLDLARADVTPISRRMIRVFVPLRMQG